MKLTLFLLTFSVFGFAQEPIFYAQKVFGTTGNTLYGGPNYDTDSLVLFIRPVKENIKWVAIEGEVIINDTFTIKFDDIHVNIPGLGTVFIIQIPKNVVKWEIKKEITEVAK